MIDKDKFKVASFLIERENRLAREAGEVEPYPNTEAGLRKFYEDISKTPAMKVYMQKHNFNKSPLL